MRARKPRPRNCWLAAMVPSTARLDHEPEGEGWSWDVLGWAAFAVHPQRVTRVALEPQVHVGDRLRRVAARDDVEDPAFSGDDRQRSALLGEQ